MIESSIDHKLKVLESVMKDIITKNCILFFSNLLDECTEKTSTNSYKYVHRYRIFQDYLISNAPLFCCKMDLLENHVNDIKTTDRFYDVYHTFVYLYYKFYANEYIDNAKTINRDNTFLDKFLREIFSECARKLFVSPHILEGKSVQLQTVINECIDIIIKKYMVLDILIKKGKKKEEKNLNQSLLSKMKQKENINDFIMK
jgi:hypothetical protein